MRRPAWDSDPIQILRDWKPRGVIHVGANDGEEFVFYKAMGIQNLVGFEPLPAPFKKFTEDHPDVLKFMVGWGDRNTRAIINVTENDKASSVLPVVEIEGRWQDHEVFKDWNMGQWPVIATDDISIVRFEDYARTMGNWRPEDYNFLNMDVQGMEFAALVGMGKQLDYFDALVIECSEKAVYQGEHTTAEVAELLAERGFEQATRTMLHGDVLFLRKDQIDA